MLSGIVFDDKIALEKEHLEQERKEKKDRQKAKKQKKLKKEKRKKEKARQQQHRAAERSGSADSGSEDDQDEGQQRSRSSSPNAEAAAQPQIQREDWMTVRMAPSQLFAKQELKKQQQEAEKKEEEDTPVEAGIRYMKPEQAAAAAAAAAAREAAGAAGKAPVVSAAAGAAWRVRALQRAQQLAKEQGRELNEVLSERWGSAAEMAKGIMEGAATAAATREPPDGGQRLGSRQEQQQRQQQGGPTAHYLADIRSERAAMKRPSSIGGSNKLSWRRPGAAADSSRGQDSREGRKGQPEQPEQQEQREQQLGSMDRRGLQSPGGDHEEWPVSSSSRRQPRDGEREPGDSTGNGRRYDRHDRVDRVHSRDDTRDSYNRSGSDGRRGRGEDPDDSRSDRSGHRGSREGPPGSRTGRGGREEQAPGAGSRGGAVEEGGGGGGGRANSRGQRQQQQERDKVATIEALKAVAGAINTFSDDGSFMKMARRLQNSGSRSCSPPPADDAAADDHRAAPPAAEAVAAVGKADGPTSPEPDLADSSAVASVSNRSTADLLRASLGGGKKQPEAAGGGEDSSGGAAAGGNRSAAELLRQRLAGRAGGSTAAPGGGGDGGREVVMLPLVDAAGRAMPGAFGRESAAEARRKQEAAAGGRVAKRVQRYGSDGTRERYFADDDATDLQTLVKRAKHGDDSMDIDRSLAANIAARSRFKETDLDADAEYDYDAGLDMSDSRRKRGDAQQQAARERQHQVASFNRQQRLEQACSLCFSNPSRPRELTIAVGQSTYLSLVQRGRLVEGHCCIMPAEHIPSTRQVDEATWTEIRNFQKCLIQMFMAQGKEVLFLETATGLSGHKNHALIEAIPMDPDAFGKAPLYFKKALQEAESEWSQHAAKSVIETKNKGLRGSIPPNFPYLYVQFSYGNGFVHVIDDENKFDRQLGRQVAIGLLRLPAEVMHRKQRVDAPAVQASMAAHFRKQFSPYDWTKALDQ